MRIEMVLTLIAVALGVGVAVGILLRRKLAEARIANAERAAEQILQEAGKEADTIRKEAVIQAKDTVLEAKSDWEKESREMRREILAQEKRLLQKEEYLERKSSQVDAKDEELGRRDKNLGQQEDRLKSREQDVEKLVLEQTDRLEKVSGMSSEEAKKHLMEAMESEARHDAAKWIKQIEDEARETADKKSKEILALAIQRYAGDFVAEKTVSVVPLPSDEMKGRIIGREGRNIRAIEAATGIDLIIDDTPEAVIISGFNPVRREVARLALERLIADGRIPSGPHRGGGQQGRTGCRHGDSGGRRAGHLRCRGTRHSPGDHQAHRSAQVPHLLRAERAPAFFGGGLLVRDHGLRTRPQRQAGQARRPAARYRQGCGP